jgi:hypothetical protein
MARGVQEARTALIAPRNRRAPLIEAGATLSVWPALVMGLGRLLGQRSGCVFLPGPHTRAAELRDATLSRVAYPSSLRYFRPPPKQRAEPIVDPRCTTGRTLSLAQLGYWHRPVRRMHMIFAAPIVERNALQSGTLQHFDVARLIVCNRQDRVSECQTGCGDLLHIVAEVGRDLLPCRMNRRERERPRSGDQGLGESGK